MENITEFSQNDPLLAAITKSGINPASILETGCANGWRLAALSKSFSRARLAGLDPSAAALAAGQLLCPTADLRQGTADKLPFEAEFELVIFGFCLYLCDREDLFCIAAEADRVLSDGGVLAIMDFYTDHPVSRPYQHAADLYSYKMNYSRLFAANPAYRYISQQICWHPNDNNSNPDDRLEVSLLYKQLANAYPEK